MANLEKIRVAILVDTGFRAGRNDGTTEGARRRKFDCSQWIRMADGRQPQTLRATEATSSSLRHCSSIVSRLPAATEANPHCVLMARFSSGM